MHIPSLEILRPRQQPTTKETCSMWFTKGNEIPLIQLSFLIRLTEPLKLTGGPPPQKRFVHIEE